MLIKDSKYLFLLMLIVVLLLIILFILKRKRAESYFNSNSCNTNQETDSIDSENLSGSYIYPNDSSFVYDKSNYSMCRNIGKKPLKSNSYYSNDKNIYSYDAEANCLNSKKCSYFTFSKDLDSNLGTAKYYKDAFKSKRSNKRAFNQDFSLYIKQKGDCLKKRYYYLPRGDINVDYQNNFVKDASKYLDQRNIPNN